MKQFLLFGACIFFTLAMAAKEKVPVKNNVSGKIYFSNKPFGETNAGAKTSFASNEYIYGRLEVKGGTLKEVFKIQPVCKCYAERYFF